MTLLTQSLPRRRRGLRPEAVDVEGRVTADAALPSAGLRHLATQDLFADERVGPLTEAERAWLEAGTRHADPLARLLQAKLRFLDGDNAEAETLWRGLLDWADLPVVHRALAHLCKRDWARQTEAADHSAAALTRAPEHAGLHSEHGLNCILAGRFAEGRALMARAVALAPDRPYLEMIALWQRQYDPAVTDRDLGAALRHWAARYLPDPGPPVVWDRDTDPERRLRIAYVSADFRDSSLLHTFEPILDGHDRAVVETVCYGNVTRPDAATERVRAKVDHYRDIAGLDLEAATAVVAADRIDILVALGGHCHGNGLPILARRPAPILVDWGSPTTTGLSQIDYRITDPCLDPPETRGLFTESLAYLPGGFCAYRPPDESPLVAPLPAQRQGVVTFGSFNNHVKISEPTLDLWGRVLRRVPDSRLLLHCRVGNDAGLRRYFREALGVRGVDPERLTVQGPQGSYRYLEALGRVDLLLDTTPFSGCVTTLEALWMGVPAVTLSGETCVSRQGRNVLQRVGLGIFAARSDAEYVDKACAFAAQPAALAAIRADLRQRMLDSPLCRPGRVAGEIEQAYRAMWRRWCAGQGGGA